MENLLSMPITPVEGDVGKIVPYVAGGLHSGHAILGIGGFMFGVPVYCSLMMLSLALDAVQSHQSGDRLYLFHHRLVAEPTAGDAAVADVRPACIRCRASVSVRRHAGLAQVTSMPCRLRIICASSSAIMPRARRW